MTESYRISDGRAHGYRLSNLIDGSYDVKSITDLCVRRMLAPIIQHDYPLYTVAVLGVQGSGKTEVCKYLSYLTQKKYGIENVNTVFTDNPSIAYKKLDKKPIQLVVIDDAAQHLGSKSAGKQDELDEWFLIRHKAMAAAGSDTGRIITILNWQRYATVHPNFRNPDMWLFTSSMADTSDIRQVRYRTGPLAYDALSENWDAISDGDLSARSNVMARISARPLPVGAGWFKTEYMRTYDPDWTDWPELMRTGQKKKTLTREEVLDRFRKEKEHELLVKIHDMYHIDGKMQSEIAKELDISQSQISKILAKLEVLVEEEISG